MDSIIYLVGLVWWSSWPSRLSSGFDRIPHTFVATSSLFSAAKTAASGIANASSGVASLVSRNIDPMAMVLDNIMRASGQQTPTGQERHEASRIFASALASDKIEQSDRDYLASRLAARSGISGRMRRRASTSPMRVSCRPRKPPSRRQSAHARPRFSLRS